MTSIVGIPSDVTGLTITGVTDATREYEFIGEFTIKRNNNKWTYDPDTSVMEIVGQSADLTQMPREHYCFYGDDDAVMGVLCYDHNNVAISFDVYHNGTNWIASDGNFYTLHKYNNFFTVGYGTGTKGSTASIALDGVSFGPDGVIKLNQTVFDPGSDESLSDDGTVTVSKRSLARVVGNGGAVVLDTDPAIADGSYDGQLLIVQGTHDTNTVQIADACNTGLAGGAAVTLGAGDTIMLVWDSGDSLWYEISRSNN